MQVRSQEFERWSRFVKVMTHSYGSPGLLFALLYERIMEILLNSKTSLRIGNRFDTDREHHKKANGYNTKISLKSLGQAPTVVKYSMISPE